MRTTHVPPVATDPVAAVASAFEPCPVPFVAHDDAGRVVLWNAATEQMAGVERAAVVGRPLAEVVELAARDDAGRHPERVWASFGDGPVVPVDTTRWTVPAGESVLHCVLLHDARPRVTFEATQDKIVDSLRRQARSDPLTGLANRFELEEQLVACRTHPGDVTVAVIDLDGFKPVNDRHGHVVGDEVLIEIGLRLESARRPGWTVARLGGDEFVVVAPMTADDELDGVLDRLRAALAGPVRTSAGDLVVEASVGGAAASGVDGRDLLRRADKAMYVAKISRAVRHEIEHGVALLPGRGTPRDRRLGDRRAADRRADDGRRTDEEGRGRSRRA